MTVRLATSVVWDHGYESFNKDGTSTQISKLRGFNGALPARMFATMETVWGSDGREVSVLVIKQARNKHARRYDSYSDVGDATRAVLNWSKRILRERAKEA